MTIPKKTVTIEVSTTAKGAEKLAGLTEIAGYKVLSVEKLKPKRDWKGPVGAKAIYTDGVTHKEHVVTIKGHGRDLFGAYALIEFEDGRQDRVHRSNLKRVPRPKPCKHTWRVWDWRVAPNTRGASGRGRSVPYRRTCTTCSLDQQKVYKPRFPGSLQVRSHWAREDSHPGP